MGIVIDRHELRRLRTIDKPMAADWIDEFIASMASNGPQLQIRREILELTTGPTRGTMSIVLKQSLTWADSYTAALLFRPIGSEQQIVLVRANGPHGHAHTVDQGGMRYTFAGMPHIHYCTEAGLRATLHRPNQEQASAFAVVVGEYSDLRGAARALARRVSIPMQRSFDDVSAHV
jgi:hypothetical protein